MKSITRLLPLFVLLFGLGCAGSRKEATVRLSPPIGEGWAQNAVNAVIFRKNSVVTHGQTQYTAYYDPTGHMVLAKRQLPNGPWNVKQTPYTGNVQDAHNTISLMVDGAGYLHLSWDHHGHPLRYCRSTAPGSLELTEKMPMVGTLENDVTYPEFHRLADGNLLFLYRSGASGRGNLVMNRYHTARQTWERVHDVLIDGEGQRNAYWQATVDQAGGIHLSWVWRERPDVASNHDLAYARSTDGGRTWHKTTGGPYTLPITAANAEYAVRIPEKSELINQTSMYADAQGRPYIATYWRPQGTAVPQYHLVYHDGTQWHTRQVSNRSTPFSLSGAGTKKIPISRPQIAADESGGKLRAYLLFRDAERDSRVSLAECPDLAAGTWTVRDLTEETVGDWEPSYDTELWKQAKQLHIFVQRVGQGDGESLEALPPQPVRILEWVPGQ